MFSWILDGDERSRAVERVAVASPVLRWDFTWGVFGSVPVDVAPGVGVQETELGGLDADHGAVLCV